MFINAFANPCCRPLAPKLVQMVKVTLGCHFHSQFDTEYQDEALRRKARLRYVVAHLLAIRLNFICPHPVITGKAAFLLLLSLVSLELTRCVAANQSLETPVKILSQP